MKNVLQNKHNWKNRTKWRKYWQWSIQEIALASLLIAFSISLFWIEIKIISSRTKLDYLFYIIMAFIFSFYKASIIGVITDTLLSLLRGTIGFWMINYAIIPIVIALLVTIFKNFILNHDISFFYWKVFLTNLISLSLLIIASTIIFITISNDDQFIKYYYYYLIFILFFIIYNLFFYSYIYWLIDKKNQKILAIKINTFVLLFMIILLSFIGSFNYALWIRRLGGSFDWSKLYLPILERTIKVFIYTPIYTIFLISLYPIIKRAQSQLQKHW